MATQLSSRSGTGRRAPGRRTPWPGRRRVLPLLAIGALAWLLVAAVQRVAYADRVLPGVVAAGVELGGSTPAQARRRLATLRSGSRSVTLVDRGRRFRVAAADVGFRLDADATVARALDAGREGPARGLVSAVTRLVTPAKVDPSWTVARPGLDDAVARIARQVDRSVFAGGLRIDPATLTVDAVAPRPGRVVDRRAARAAIFRALRDDAPTVRAPLRATSAPRLAEVESVADRARAYLARPLRLTSRSTAVSVAPRRLAATLEVRATDTGGVALGARRDRVAALVREIAAQRNRPAVDARISAPAAPVTVDDRGDMSWRPRPARVTVRRGRAGVRLEEPEARASIASAVSDGRHTATLSLRPVAPTITASAARRVRRLIGTFTTRYPCCEPRVRNIQRIARAVDRTVIAPGGRFSLNGVAGRRTRAKGYVPAPFISGGKIVPSVGGGVSQFATTIYNAVYFAGLKIDAHQPHSLYIDRYPAGREATVDFGSIDMAWTNDTGVPVLVRASTTATSVTVSLFGDNGGRRVQARSGPRQDVPERDFAVTVTRIIRRPGGPVSREAYTTTYDRPPAAE